MPEPRENDPTDAASRGQARWQIGPLTTSALAAVTGEHGDGPPALVDEWSQTLARAGDFVVLWAGAARGAGERETFSWSWFVVRTGDEDQAEAREGEGAALPPHRDPACAAKVESMLTSLAHEARVRILQALFGGVSTSSALSAETGLKGGNLYHHLRGLLHAGYVAQTGEGYALTSFGRQMLITMAYAADQVVHDRGEEGFGIGLHR